MRIAWRQSPFLSALMAEARGVHHSAVVDVGDVEVVEDVEAVAEPRTKVSLFRFVPVVLHQAIAGNITLVTFFKKRVVLFDSTVFRYTIDCLKISNGSTKVFSLKSNLLNISE